MLNLILFCCKSKFSVLNLLVWIKIKLFYFLFYCQGNNAKIKINCLKLSSEFSYNIISAVIIKKKYNRCLDDIKKSV